MSLRRILVAALVSVAPAVAWAQCDVAPSPPALEALDVQSNELAAAFKQAFLEMPMDKSTATVSTVGSALVGSGLANELSATIQGVKQVVVLRSRLRDPDDVSFADDQVERALTEAGARARRVSIAYGQVARMAYTPKLKGLAAQGMAFASELAEEWGCK